MTSPQDSVIWSEGEPELLFKRNAVIDEGAFGTVWKGVPLKEGKGEVAIKIMPKKEEVMEELESEVNFLRQFDSPFVIHYFGTWLNKKNDEIWIVMELAELGSVEGIMIFCEYNFSEKQLAALFARVLLGLDYIHSKNLVHQDIKAKNILLTLRGEVKLADFGVAASVTNVNANRGTVSGSPHWMAPEILSGGDITQKCDIWSLGITLLELTDGQPPLADIPPINVISIIPEKPAPTFSTPSEWSKSAKAFLARMCKKNPEDRRNAARLMKHPFVKEEVMKALTGDHELLKQLAEECYETIKETREALEEDEDLMGSEVDDVYDSEEYDTDSSDDDGPLIVGNGRWRKNRAKSRKSAKSFASVVVDESKLIKEPSKSKLRRRRGRGTKMTMAGGRKKSNATTAFQKQTSAKFSMLQNKRKNLELNLNDINNQGDEKTRAKAKDLLDKIMGLTNRKKL